jgi:glycosyltransferase involved in cell wall biosynthesis
MKRVKLSVVLSTINEEENIGPCLKSVKNIADEVIVVDEESIDKTRDIAKQFGAKVYKVKHEEIFHKTKQKALDYAMGDWILQLDADERVTPKLVKEIRQVLKLSDAELRERRPESKKKWKLFQRHQKLVEQKQGSIAKKTGEVVAFFIPRVNYFLNKPLKYAGVYPDGVIRLVKNGKARFPAKSVHELMEIDGEVAWLFNDLEHHDSPTFNRYLERANRYTDLAAKEFQNSKTPSNYLYLFYYSFIKPTLVFLNLYIRHKGFLDGMRGFIWSVFSAFHFPIAYFKYWQREKGAV